MGQMPSSVSQGVDADTLADKIRGLAFPVSHPCEFYLTK